MTMHICRSDMAIVFEVPGEPRGKGRPRFNRQTGITYTDSETSAYEKKIMAYYRQQLNGFRWPDGTYVSVAVTAVYPIPKSATKASVAAIHEGKIDIRFPNITAPTDAGKLQQMQSYMHQLVGQLNWALNNIDVTGGGSDSYLTKTTSPAQTTNDDPISEFNSIKGLIIKSADIVHAYYEEINNLLKLSGEYVAQSDFGEYQQSTQNLVKATEKLLEQELVDKQTIFDENGNIKAELLVNGHIYSGIIEYAKDGEAIVGIEIGQTTKVNGVDKFNKFARFTADRLEFYNAINPDEPVAYISDYKLYITHVEIKGSLKEGGYVDTITADGGIVTKWEGGS